MTITGKHIKEFRQYRGLSLHEIEKFGGFPKTSQWFGQLENGIQPLTEERANKMLECICTAYRAKWTEERLKMVEKTEDFIKNLTNRRSNLSWKSQ